MAKPKRKWPRILLMVGAAVVLVGALALTLVSEFAPTQTLVPQSLVSLPGTIVSTAIKPLQGLFGAVTNGVTGYLDNLKLQKTIEIEYNNLRAQNENLIYASLYNDELEIENDRLRRLLGVFEDKVDMNPIMATVTAKETGNWFQMFTIDKGEKHGIVQYMAVIHEKGLVGYIYDVDETTSQVVSIIDSRASISGIIQSSRDQGMVRGTLGVEDDPSCRMYYLPVDLITRPGDTVVTSGIGLPFPKGIVIGTIRESTKYLDENKQYVVIEPAVDFQHLEEVIVLVTMPPKEDMPESNDGQVHYQYSPLDTMRPVPTLGVDISDVDMGAVTAPPRATRRPVIDLTDGSAIEYEDDPDFTLAPGATPTPNPELDELMRQELEEEAMMENEVDP